MYLIRNTGKFVGAGEANYRHRLKAPLFTAPQSVSAADIYRNVFAFKLRRDARHRRLLTFYEVILARSIDQAIITDNSE